MRRVPPHCWKSPTLPIRSFWLLCCRTFAWVFTVVAGWGIAMFARNIFRASAAIIRTLWYRAMQSAGNLGTWTICRNRSLLPKRTASSLELMVEVQFDDFDFPLLRPAPERGPGFSTSAAELAGKYSLLPPQFQKTLGKPSSNKMLTTVITATDGFENYRITDYGSGQGRTASSQWFRFAHPAGALPASVGAAPRLNHRHAGFQKPRSIKCCDLKNTRDRTVTAFRPPVHSAES